jgi:hypothetical protein
MVIVIFAATYLFAAVLYTVITALAAGERARAFKGILRNSIALMTD